MKIPLNNKQEEVRRFYIANNSTILICDGAVGSGKTTIASMCYLDYLWKNRGFGRDYILTGYTLGSLERNIFSFWRDQFGIDADPNQDGVFELWGNRINCFGTNNADSWKAIRGIMTAYGGYMNEATLSHRASIEEVFNRCRGVDARFVIETNPSSPDHYIHRNWIEEAVRIGNTKELARFNFSIYDNDKAHNGFLPDEYIKRQEKTYSGASFLQNIKGEWKEIEGQIYHLDDLQYYDDSQFKTAGGIIHGAIDPATGSKQKTGCFTSFITGCLKGDTIYILDAVVKKLGVTETIATVGEHIQKYNYSKLAVEDNFSQAEYVLRPIKQKYPFANIVGQSAREEKISRLIGMENVVKTRVIFPERFRTDRNSDGWLLLQQLCNITKDSKETITDEMTFLDAPDALEQLLRTFRNYQKGKTTVAHLGGTVRDPNWGIF